jgi:hypothetical protein
MADEIHKPKIELVSDSNENGIHDPTDVFSDLASLRNVGVDKPANNVHFRVHPDSEMRLEDATVLHDRDEVISTTSFRRCEDTPS